MDWSHVVPNQPVPTLDMQPAMTTPDVLLTRPQAGETGATLPFGPTYAPTPDGAIDALPLPWDQSLNGWNSQSTFGETSNFMLSPNFGAANDVHRSVSQPAHKRRLANPMDWSTARNNRDTLYAHEFLKAFRARMPDSAEGQAACDYCRKRKIKVRRLRHSPSATAKSRRVDTVRNRDACAHRTTCSANVGRRASMSTPTYPRRERAMMDNAGIVFRSRSSRQSKYGPKRGVGDRVSDASAAPGARPAEATPLDAQGFVVPTTTAAMAANGTAPVQASLDGLSASGLNGPNLWLSSSDATAPGMYGEAGKAGAGTASGLPAGLAMDVLNNLPSNVWPSFPPHLQALQMNATGMSANPTPSYGAAGGTEQLASPYSLPSSSLFGLGQQELSAGASSLPSSVASPVPTSDTLADDPAWKKPESAARDLSLLTKPIATDSPAAPVASASPTAREPEGAGDQCQAALDHFLTSQSVGNVATRQLTEFYAQHGPGRLTEGSPAAGGEHLLQEEAQGCTAAASMYVRVLDANGHMAHVPASEHPQSLASLYQSQAQSPPYPGAAPDSATSARMLFPPGARGEADYDALRAQADAMLSQDTVRPLLRLAKDDLQRTLPFLQWGLIERYLASATQHGVPQWTPTQARQRQALLLLLVALATTLHPAIATAAAPPTSPWPFGLACYRVARGLLTPRTAEPAVEELAQEFVESLIVLDLYLYRCKQYDEASLALSCAVRACLALSEQPVVLQPSEPTLGAAIFHREMLKRYLWVIFILDRLNQVESNGHTRMLFTQTIGALEQPALLHDIPLEGCVADEGVTPDAIRIFGSQINLAHILGEAAAQGLLASKPTPQAPGSALHTAAVLFQEKLTRWASDSPCIIHSPSHPTTDLFLAAWTTPSSLNLRVLYQACLGHLQQYALA